MLTYQTVQATHQQIVIIIPHLLGSTEDAKDVFSEGQLIFSGSGSLYVNTNYKMPFEDDYIRVYDGKSR